MIIGRCRLMIKREVIPRPVSIEPGEVCRYRCWGTVMVLGSIDVGDVAIVTVSVEPDVGAIERLGGSSFRLFQMPSSSNAPHDGVQGDVHAFIAICCPIHVIER